MEGAAGGHFGRDLIQDRPELDALALGGRDFQRLQQRRARADQGRELMEEGQRIFELGPFVRLSSRSRMCDNPFLERQIPPLFSG